MVQRLGRDRVDQVNPEIVEAGGAAEVNTPEGFGRVVNAAEESEIFAAKRLNPDAQPVHAEGTEGSQGLLVHRAGVCFQGNLGVCRDLKRGAQTGENSVKLSGGQQRGSAAAEEDGLEDDSAVFRAPECDLLSQRRQEALDQFGAVDRIEVAIEALPLTEGDVDIQGRQGAPRIG
jgi:hypothetical protein